MNGTLMKDLQKKNCTMQNNYSGNGANTAVRFKPMANISQSGNGWHIDVALPGYGKEDINVEIVDRNLKISSTSFSKNEENSTEEKSNIAKFERTFLLPENANGKDITASLTQGILHLFIPLHEEKMTKINIQ